MALQTANSLQILALLMTDPKEVAKLAGVDVVMDFKKETLIELKCARELLHELPDTFNELSEDRGYFFGVTIQMATPRKMQAKQGYILCHPTKKESTHR